EMIARGSDPADILAFLPPAIGPCCFETDGDVPDAMRRGFGREADPFLRPVSPGRCRVDLWGINAHALFRRGLLPEHIEVTRLCSWCHDVFYSHRRSGRARGLSCGLIRLPS
ncbi:MAG: laccase domain-containing protein, partial [Clostridia bacterium]|nr:laccase domain-containing protein [Clostridia bacterium]